LTYLETAKSVRATDELVRKLRQPEPEGLEPKIETEKQKKPAGQDKRIRQNRRAGGGYPVRLI